MNEQHDFRETLRSAGLDQMVSEAHAKGHTDVTREQIEATVAADPNGAAAARLADYEKLGQAALLAAGALERAGVDPKTLSSEQLLRCAQAAQGCLDRAAAAEAAPAPAPAREHDHGAEWG